MTREEAIIHMEIRRNQLKSSVAVKDLEEDIKAFDMAIKALEQKSCEDCVSRERVVEFVKNYPSFDFDKLVEELYELPSVTPTEWEQDHKLLKDCGNAVDIVLDKIRAEIEDLDIYYDNDRWSSNNEQMYIASEVLAIIDKYRGK